MSPDQSKAVLQFSAPAQLALRQMFEQMAAGPRDDAASRNAFQVACRDAHAQHMARAQVVSAFRGAFDRVRRPIERRPADWEREFRRALGRCLEAYFA